MHKKYQKFQISASVLLRILCINFVLVNKEVHCYLMSKAIVNFGTWCAERHHLSFEHA